jgi:tight adherence protein C
MAIAISALLFCLLLAVIAIVGNRLWAKPVRIQERLAETGPAEQAIAGGSPDYGQPAEKQWIVRVVERVGEKAPISPQEAKLARRNLMAAGYRTDNAVRIYYGAKFVFCGLFLVLALLLRGVLDNPLLGLLVVIAGPALGFFAPNFVLEKMVDRRRERIRLSLPDALDLMVICMEAGLGIDQAIASVSRELRDTHPDICDELGLVTLEMRAGTRRVDALQNLGNRTGESDLKKLVATIIQADRFGTGVAESLRTHSDFMRVRRRQAAEERANKVGVKLVFPIFFFIMPSVLVIAAGPGMIMVLRGLSTIAKP